MDENDDDGGAEQKKLTIETKENTKKNTKTRKKTTKIKDKEEGKKKHQ